MYLYKAFRQGSDHNSLICDDLIIAGSNDDVINDVKRTLNKRYKMKDMGLLDWILGMEVIQNTGAKLIRLNQTRYIQQMLGKIDINTISSTPMGSRYRLSKSDSPTTEGEKLYMRAVRYREAVGSLLWLAN